MRTKHTSHEWLEGDVNATVDVQTFPWVGVQLDHANKPPRRKPPPTEGRPNVAICLAGDARTLFHTSVWRSVWRLRGGRRSPSPLDLFLVLGTSAERVKLGEHADQGRSSPVAPHPRLLEHALEAIEPTAVHIVTRPDPPSCNRSATAQFAKWARCVEMIRRHPHRPYDFLFKGRPDVVIHRPIDLRALAAQLDPSAILPANDVLLLAHRSKWHALTALRPGVLRCDQRCSGDPASPHKVLRKLVKGYNEYCLLSVAWAELGVNHLEASHPTEPEWLVQRTRDVIGADASRPAYDYGEVSWAGQLYARNGWKIVRQEEMGHHAALEQAAKRAALKIRRQRILLQRGGLPSPLPPHWMERAVQHYVSGEVLSAVVCAPRRWTSNESSSRCPRNGGTHVRCVRCTNIRHAREEPGLYADAIGVGNRRVQPWAIPPLKLATSAMSAQLPACPSFVEYGTGGDSQSTDSSWSEWPTQAQQRATERESTRMREALLPLCTPPKRCRLMASAAPSAPARHRIALIRAGTGHRSTRTACGELSRCERSSVVA